MIPKPLPPPDNIGDTLQAAIALGREARRRGQESILPEHAPQDPGRFLLIEGTMNGCFLEVAMPSGEIWRYRHDQPDSDGRVLLIHIDTTAPLTANIFRPSAEGMHPFLCEGIRFGVERKAA